MKKQRNVVERDVGRPTLMTEETLKKLEEVFAIGGTDKEACFYADISHQTLYTYQEKHPEFVERKEALKERPVLKARQTVIKALDNVSDAQWYLERKAKREFAQRNENVNLNVEVQPIYGGLPRHDSNEKDILPEEKD